MSITLNKIRLEIKESIKILQQKKSLCPSNKTVKTYINGEIAGLGIALHQIESELFYAETDVFTKNTN